MKHDSYRRTQVRDPKLEPTGVGLKDKVVLGCNNQFVKVAPNADSKEKTFPTFVKCFVLVKIYKTEKTIMCDAQCFPLISIILLFLYPILTDCSWLRLMIRLSSIYCVAVISIRICHVALYVLCSRSSV